MAKEPIISGKGEAKTGRETMKMLQAVRDTAESSMQVVDFDSGFILIPEMKGFDYAPGKPQADPEMLARAKAFEQRCAAITIDVLHNISADAIKPVDLIISIGKSGIPYGITFAQVYEQWLRLQDPGVEVAHLAIQKQGSIEAYEELFIPGLPVGPDGRVDKQYGEVIPIQSFTQKVKVPFIIPKLSAQMLERPNRDRGEDRKRYDAEHPRRAIIVDDVLAHGHVMDGIISNFERINPSVKIVAAVTMMAKEFQGGEKHIRELFRIRTFSPLRFRTKDEVNRTYRLAPISDSFRIAA